MLLAQVVSTRKTLLLGTGDAQELLTLEVWPLTGLSLALASLEGGCGRHPPPGPLRSRWQSRLAA